MDIFEHINMYDLAFTADGEWGIKLPPYVLRIVRTQSPAHEWNLIVMNYADYIPYALKGEPVPLSIVKEWVETDLLTASL